MLTSGQSGCGAGFLQQSVQSAMRPGGQRKFCDGSTSGGRQGALEWLNQSKRGIGKTIRHLLSPYLPKSSPLVTELRDLIKLMSALQLGKVGSVRVISINIPGKAIFVTEELLRTLEAQEELALTCATNTR